MKGLRDPGGSNPLPPMYNRLTGCAGYIFDCGDYGRLEFSVWLELPKLCIYVMIMILWTVLYPAPLWYVALPTILTLGNLFHNYDWYSLTWFSLNACLTAHMSSIDALWLQLPLSPLNLRYITCLDPNFDTAPHHDSALTWTWTHKICTLSL